MILEDHFASDAINGGVAAQAGFAASFDGEAVSELYGLRADFLRKAVLAGTDQADLPAAAGRRDQPGRPAGDDAGRGARVRRARPAAAAAGRARPARGAGSTLLIDPATRRAIPRGGGPAAPAPGPVHADQHQGEQQHLPRHAAAPIRLGGPGTGPRGGEESPVKAVRSTITTSSPSSTKYPSRASRARLTSSSKSARAGVCRTDLHIIEGQWAERTQTVLPYTLGHENAGWVHEVGSGVANVAVGDTVILHPAPSCGLCRPCRAGDDMHCENSAFPGLANRDGGMAEYLLTTARGCVKLDPQTQPQGISALANAGVHRLSRGPQGHPAVLPGHHLRGHRRGGPRPHRRPVPGRAHRHQDHRGGPQPRRGSSSPSSLAGTRLWSPTAGKRPRCST